MLRGTAPRSGRSDKATRVLNLLPFSRNKFDRFYYYELDGLYEMRKHPAARRHRFYERERKSSVHPKLGITYIREQVELSSLDKYLFWLIWYLIGPDNLMTGKS